MQDRITMTPSEQSVTSHKKNEKSVFGRVFSDGWGPDAKLTLNVRSSEFNIVQHTEGRGESSRAMLDLSVSGLGNVVESIGGWLVPDGALLAGEAPSECRERDSGNTMEFELLTVQRKSVIAGVFSH